MRAVHVAPKRARRSSPVRNVLLISPTDFTGNTALHAYAVAEQLAKRGYAPAIAVPAHRQTVNDVGAPGFPILTFRETKTLTFDDGRGPDLLHVFTPRGAVRRVTLGLLERHRCPFVVHLEDNEDAVGNGFDSDASAFLKASGVTVVTERLLELAPPGVPSTVVWPGFDEAVLAPRRDRADVREELGLNETLAIVYNGNVHGANVGDDGASTRLSHPFAATAFTSPWCEPAGTSCHARACLTSVRV